MTERTHVLDWIARLNKIVFTPMPAYMEKSVGKVERGRQSRPSRISLDLDDVKSVKRRLAAGQSVAEISDELGIGASIIGAIKSGKRWADIEAT